MKGKVWKQIVAIVLVMSMSLGNYTDLFAEKANTEKEYISFIHGDDTNGVITEDGSLYMWGRNGCGQVGNGTTEDQLKPVKVLSNVVSVSLHGSYSGAITEDGSLYMWGYNGDGQLGNGTTEDQLKPVKVLSDVVSVSLDGDYSGAITKDGSLYMWGDNYYGQLGNGTTKNQLKPVKVLSDVVSVSLAGSYSGAITKDGSLYTWGDNDTFGLGTETVAFQLHPIKVLSNVVSVRLGIHINGAITEDGSLYMWGSNYYGQLGNGNKEVQLSPIKVLSDIVYVGWDGSHNSYISGAITEDGSLYMWGDNYYGQLGNGTEENQLIPVKVLSDVVSVSLDYYRSGAITEDGSLYMWGYNGDGQLGNGTTKNQLNPVKVLSGVVSVSLDSGTSGAITEDGSLYMWGYNEYGQLGNGTEEDQLIPVKVLSDVVSVSLDGRYSGAITKDNCLYMCGYNAYGQVGLGSELLEVLYMTKILDNESQTPEIEEVQNTKTVKYFSGWDSEQQIADFGILDMSLCQATENTNFGFLSELDSLLNSYVLVEENDIEGTNELLSIKPVNSYTGTIEAMIGKYIDIDGKTYEIDVNDLHELYMQLDVDDFVLYHVYNGKIVGLEKLEKYKGTISHWNSSKNDISIALDEEFDGSEYGTMSYWLSNLADKGTIDYLSGIVQGNVALVNPIEFICDTQGFVYHLEERQYSIKAFANQPSTTLGLEENLTLYVELYLGDEKIPSPEGFEIMGMDDWVISCTETSYEDDSWKYVLEPVNYGNVILTFSDASWAEPIKVPITVEKEKNIHKRCFDISSDYESFESSIYIDNYSCIIDENGNHDIKFNAYNGLYSYSVVEVRDKKGNLLKCVPLAPRSDESGIRGVTDALYQIIESYDTSKPWYALQMNSEHTLVELKDVPEGAEIIITGSMQESMYVSFYTGMKIALEVAFKLSDVNIGKEDKKNFVQELSEELMNCVPVHMIEELTENISMMMMNSALDKRTLSKEIYESFKELFEKLKETDSMDFKEFLTDSLLKMGYEVTSTLYDGFLEKLPNFKGFEVMFEVMDLSQLAWIIVDYGSSRNLGKFIIYTQDHTKINYLAGNGVTVAGNSNFSSDTMLLTEQYDEQKKEQEFPKNSIYGFDLRNFEVYDLALVKSGATAELEETLTVNIPIPKRADLENCRVFILEELEDTALLVRTEIPFNCSDGGVSFEATKLGTFIVDYELLPIAQIFSDVYDDWYNVYVEYVFDKGIMSGNNGLFKPTGNITRAQVVTTLYNLEGSPNVTDYKACTELKDVQKDAWYTNAVCWAYNTGVGSGNSSTKMFNMNTPVTRQQIASFFFQYAKYKGYDISKRSDLSNLLNVDKVSSYAADSIRWAVSAGIISGSKTTDNAGNTVYDLNPTGTATRAQMAAILQRFCENYNL